MAATTIPVELVRQIVSYLRVSDLLSVSLLGPNWYSPAQEALYQAPNLSTVSAMPFLRTILTPGLAILRTHVRTLSVRWPQSEVAQIAASDIAHFHAAADIHGLTEPCNTTNSIVQLLLRVLPRVQVLHLSPPNTYNSHTEFLGSAMELPLTLRTIRELSMCYLHISGAMLVQLLELPTLRVLTVQLLDELTDDFAPVHGSSSITTLHIAISQIAISSLGRILLAPRGLKHLSLTSMTSARSILLGAFYTALAPLRPTLQVLEVVLGRDPWPYPDPVLLGPPLESFCNWPVLRALRCPMRLLLGDCGFGTEKHLWQVVPAGLCEMEIAADQSWWSGDTVQELGELLWQKRQVGLVPRLRRVTVGVELGDAPIDWWILKGHCRSAQVELLIGGFKFVGVEGVEGIDA